MSTLADRARGKISARPLRDVTESTVIRPAPEARVMGWVAFCAYLVLGIYMSFNGVFEGDAVSRMADAYYVLFSRDPHFGAIGFVWNPLPAVLEIPLAALHPLWPAIVSRGVGAGVLSAVFGGLSAYFLTNILKAFGLSRGWRIAIACTYLINPFIAFYSGNGMTAVMLTGSLFGCMDGLLRYLKTKTLRYMLAAGIWLAIAFLIRYEAVAFGAFVAVGLVVGMYAVGTERRRIEADVILFLMPITYAAAIWMYFNWLIMKNPLYFMNSVYSNASQQATSGGLAYRPLALAHHSLMHSFLYVGSTTLLFWPVVPAFIVVLWLLCKRRLDISAYVLLAGSVAIPALQFVLLYLGESSGVDRYFAYFIPMGVLLVAYATAKLAQGQRWRRAALAGAVIVLLLGDCGTLWAEHSSLVASHGVNVMNPTQVAAMAVADYVNEHPDMTFLVDTFEGYPIALDATRPTQLVISSDRDFESVLENPRGRVDAFVVPRPTYAGVLDAVNRQWPLMWAGHVPWVRLIAQFPKTDPAWRVYAIEGNSP